MRWWPCVLMAVGCGRIGFGDLDGAADAPSAEAGNDGPPSDGASDGPTDGPAACRSNGAYTARGSQSHRYRTVGVDASWADARAACEADGAYLAIPDSAAEAAVLDGDWMGLTDGAAEGQWLTLFGAPAPYLPWDAGEPSGGAGQNCARLDDNTGLLEARQCSDERDYICECD